MEKNIAGWLIINTEKSEYTSFDLFEGKNLIGRKTPNYTPDIALDDNYVSRKHAVLIVRKNENNFYEYLIADNAELNGKPSSNGTFINGDKQRLGDKVQKIIDGDTIQIGMTKLVLKSANISLDINEATKLVKKQEFQPTINVVKQAKLSKKIRK